MIPPYWEQAKKTLSKTDPVMKGIIRAYHGEALTSKGDAFYTLARSIVGQQISVKAADSVWKKLESRVENREFHDDEALRACGLSRQKVIYLQSLADFFIAEHIHENYWDNMSDEEVIRHITQVKGIGRWSAEMFLIFHLLRPDVFPVDDIGLQKAIVRHYGNICDIEQEARLVGRVSREPAERRPLRRSEDRSRGNKTTLKEFQHFSSLWQPYRSVATWYLWRSLDPVPVEY